jgi:hypothetical protein
MPWPQSSNIFNGKCIKSFFGMQCNVFSEYVPWFLYYQHEKASQFFVDSNWLSKMEFK